MVETRNAYRILVLKHVRKRHFEDLEGDGRKTFKIMRTDDRRTSLEVS
jgi:hypothetical protein